MHNAEIALSLALTYWVGRTPGDKSTAGESDVTNTATKFKTWLDANSGETK